MPSSMTLVGLVKSQVHRDLWGAERKASRLVCPQGPGKQKQFAVGQEVKELPKETMQKEEEGARAAVFVRAVFVWFAHNF